MNEPPFVVSRPDGFIGVEVNVSYQLTPKEAFEFAARITTCAVEEGIGDPNGPLACITALRSVERAK